MAASLQDEDDEIRNLELTVHEKNSACNIAHDMRFAQARNVGRRSGIYFTNFPGSRRNDRGGLSVSRQDAEPYSWMLSTNPKSTFCLEGHFTEIAFDILSARLALEAFNCRKIFGFNFDPSHFLWQMVDP